MEPSARTPGLLLTGALAGLAYAVHSLPIPPFTLADGSHPIDSVMLAIVFGLGVRQVWKPGPRFIEGIRFSGKQVLSLAIVLLGAKLDFFDVMRVSSIALLINVGCVFVGLFVTIWLCKKLGVARNLALLIAVGTAICGGTAIVVTAPVIEADERDTALAVGTVTLFGLAAIALFPLVGGLLSLGQSQFGVWAGTGIHATPQVMAAGFAYGQEAGEIAVVVKLVRVLLLAPLVVALGMWKARASRNDRDETPSSVPYPPRKRPGLHELVPPFIIGFVAVAAMNSLSLLPDFTLHLDESVVWSAGDVRVDLEKLAAKASLFLVTVAMAGISLAVDVRGLVRVGITALKAGLLATLVVATVALALVVALL